MTTLTITVNILFITPTTVYVVAETSCWHQKPEYEMLIPMKHEAPSQKYAALLRSTLASLLSSSSPATKQSPSAGRMESELVYSTGVQSEAIGMPDTRNLPYVSWKTSTNHQIMTQ